MPAAGARRFVFASLFFEHRACYPIGFFDLAVRMRGAVFMAVSQRPLIGVIAASARHAEAFGPGLAALDAHGAPYETMMAPADSTPDWAADWAAEAEGRGIEALLVLSGPGDALAAFVAAHAEIPTFALMLDAGSGSNPVSGFGSGPSAAPALPPATLGETAPVAWVWPATPLAAVMLLLQNLSLSDPSWTEHARRMRSAARDRSRADGDRWLAEGAAFKAAEVGGTKPAQAEGVGHDKASGHGERAGRDERPDLKSQISNFKPQISEFEETGRAEPGRAEWAEISDLKSQISDLKSQISNFKFQISNAGEGPQRAGLSPESARSETPEPARPESPSISPSPIASSSSSERAGSRVSEAGIWDTFAAEGAPPSKGAAPPREPARALDEAPPTFITSAPNINRGAARRRPGFIGRIRINSDILPVDLVEQASDLLLDGGVIALPTDTVYGLAVDATNEEAAERLYRIKERSNEKSIAIFIDSARALNQFVSGVTSPVRNLLEAFWPGPLTVVFAKREACFQHLTSGETIGVRIPDHPAPLALVQELRRPLACTSANPSGMPEARSADEVEEYFGRGVDMILDAGRLPQGPASTVIDVTRTPFRIIREGGISRRQLAAVAGDWIPDA